MYLLRGIPLKRAIPGGELAYISRMDIAAGSIAVVPLKKSTELILVTDCSSVSDEKEYIKSLPYKLLTLEKVEIVAEIKKDLLKIIFKFANYSLCSADKVVRALFSKADFKIKSGNTFTITNSDVKTKDPAAISFHKFINLFLNNSDKLKELYIETPARLSLYGREFLGFDPLPLFIMLADQFKFELIFNSEYKRLSYAEWEIKYSKNKVENNGKLFITSREMDSNVEKANPLSEEVVEILIKNIDKKILLLGSAKNYASRTSCSDCKTIHACVKCTKPLVLVKNNRNYAKKYGIAGEYIYVCTNCKIGENSIAKCRNCDSWNLTPLGFGIERIYEYLEKSLPKKELGRLYNMQERIGLKNLASWQENGGIIVGQLNLLYNIKESDILVVPSLAALLYGDSYDTIEKARDIIEYTKNNTQKSIICVMQESERDFLEQDDKTWEKNEKQDRKDLHYPPYARYLEITLDPYASKSPVIIDAVTKIVSSMAIDKTTTKKQNVLGITTISASFDKDSWAINPLSLKTANALMQKLQPFHKYLKINVG